MTRTFQRALITGLGAVTPIGNDVESYWEGLRTGRNGIGLVKRFDPSELIVQIAGEVDDFDVSRSLQRRPACRRWRTAAWRSTTRPATASAR